MRENLNSYMEIKKNVINKIDIGFSGKINDDNSFKFL